MTVRAVCPRCANRWCGAVLPGCGMCGGKGLIAVIDGEHLSRLRAVVMYVERHVWGSDPTGLANRVSQLRKAGLLSEGTGTVGLDLEPDHTKRSHIGRAAGQLLVDLGLRKRAPRRPPKPKMTAEEMAKAKAFNEAMRVEHEERIARMARDHRDRVVRERVFDVLAVRYPDEVGELRENENIVAAIEENLPVIGAHRPWR